MKTFSIMCDELLDDVGLSEEVASVSVSLSLSEESGKGEGNKN